MRKVLHILTKPDDALAREMIRRQQENGENETLVSDLTMPQPNYKQLLENVFAADSVEAW